MLQSIRSLSKKCSSLIWSPLYILYYINCTKRFHAWFGTLVKMCVTSLHNLKNYQVQFFIFSVLRLFLFVRCSKNKKGNRTKFQIWPKNKTKQNCFCDQKNKTKRNKNKISALEQEQTGTKKSDWIFIPDHAIMHWPYGPSRYLQFVKRF